MKFEEGAVVYLCGNRGEGKSTLLCMLAQRFIKQKHDVYCNFEIQGTYYFDVSQFGKVNFPVFSVIMIDEASILYNSRNFKNFDIGITTWIKECRKHHCMLVIASQNYNDTDKVLRDESNYLYILSKIGNFTIGKRIVNKLVLVPSSNGNQGYMGFDLYYAGLLSKGSRIVCYRPFYYRFFDSWQLTHKDEKPLVKAEKVPYKKKEKKVSKSLARYLRPLQIRNKAKN